MKNLVPILLVLPLAAADGDEFFEKKIRPVLAAQCFACHSSKLREPKANLRLDSASALRKGGDSGPALAPGKPEESRLFRAISYTDFHLRMPPTGKLSDQVIADFREWIRIGAPDPRVETAEARKAPSGIDIERGRQFWAFQPLARVAPPAVRNTAWVRTPVDAFLLAKIEAKGLRPAPEASRPVWLRRVTFDLTGLPPTPEEIAAFEKNGDYEQVVERLLASPHYGERWARHWLDLVRFAETNGHEFDNNKLDAWRYRDYVIRAFNEDLPYNRFVQEHIAGDLLPEQRISRDGAFIESPLATSFYWFGEVLNSATDSIKSRADTVDNQIDVVSKAFLGLTLSCARCHDHKFDPLPTADYYGMAGFLHSTGMREVVIDSPARAAAIHAAHQSVPERKRYPGKTRIVLRPGDEIWEDFNDLKTRGWHASGEAFALGPRESVIDTAGRGAHELTGSLTSGKFRMPKRYVHVRLNAAKGNRALSEREPVRLTLVADDFKSLHWMGSGGGTFEWVTHRMTLPYQRMCYFELVDRSRAGSIAVDAIVFSDEKDPPQTEQIAEPEWQDPGPAPVPIPESTFGMVAWDEAPADVKLHIRGNHQNLGAVVPRHFLQVLSKPAAIPALQGSGRLQLAEWMTSRESPLPARVMVNRIWRYHFGEGIVRSTDNFGLMGERPTHKELLDYLATTFAEDGWSIKQLHRKIVLSAAYRMSSHAGETAAQADPRNEVLHHFPVRRLEAEEIRDAMLAISGEWKPELYGPSVVPHISKYQDGRGKPIAGPLDGDGRRSIYIQVRRNFLTPLFLVFDYPLPISTIGGRSQSTVPSQALMLMNNEFVFAQSAKWAERVAHSREGREAQIDLLFRLAFGRGPEPSETADAVQFLDKGRSLTDLAHTLFNSPEFLYVQ